MKYDIIYADPPWMYRDKAAAGKRGACFKYPVMSLKDIKNLPVEQLASDNCTLFLWATMPLLPEAFEVIEAWGFKYKTMGFTWVKRTTHGKWHWGGGHWTRSNPELCLLGVRGKPKRINKSVHSVVDDQVGKHSAKPDTVRQRIVNLMGDLPRIELFAREKAPGWHAWGNEVESDIILPVQIG